MLPPATRAAHLRWLLDLTDLPTASGREHRVIEWITRWTSQRPVLALSADPHGNLTITHRTKPALPRPLYFTAHLDHPAFVVERIIAPTVIELSFRGGVMDEYFKDARITLHTRAGPQPALLTGAIADTEPFKRYTAELEDAADAAIGDVATWDIGPAQLIDGHIHTQACDDLAAAAAALAALDATLDDPAANPTLLFTRAEEIGFVGAIGAVRGGAIPKNARFIALENSRSFPDSPIGGGPIVRVGDRISVFSPTLTDAIAKRAEEIAGGPPAPHATQKQSDLPAWKWQRKLMAGGACEASVFCNAGYEATCVCLPLGNYHNMADLAAVQAGTNTTPPRVGREYIALSDFEGLVDLLIACARRLPEGGGLSDRFNKLWDDRRFVLSPPTP